MAVVHSGLFGWCVGDTSAGRTLYGISRSPHSQAISTAMIVLSEAFLSVRVQNRSHRVSRAAYRQLGYENCAGAIEKGEVLRALIYFGWIYFRCPRPSEVLREPAPDSQLPKPKRPRVGRFDQSCHDRRFRSAEHFARSNASASSSLPCSGARFCFTPERSSEMLLLTSRCPSLRPPCLPESAVRHILYRDRQFDHIGRRWHRFYYAASDRPRRFAIARS